MKNTSNQPLKQEERLFKSFELKKEGVTLQVELYAPTKGTGSVKGRYLAEQETLNEKGAELEKQLAKEQDELDNIEKFLALVDRHIEVPELTPDILREFVHHITVLERSGAYKKKFYTQKIEVHFNYIGAITE